MLRLLLLFTNALLVRTVSRVTGCGLKDAQLAQTVILFTPQSRLDWKAGRSKFFLAKNDCSSRKLVFVHCTDTSFLFNYQQTTDACPYRNPAVNRCISTSPWMNGTALFKTIPVLKSTLRIPECAIKRIPRVKALRYPGRRSFL